MVGREVDPAVPRRQPSGHGPGAGLVPRLPDRFGILGRRAASKPGRFSAAVACAAPSSAAPAPVRGSCAPTPGTRSSDPQSDGPGCVQRTRHHPRPRVRWSRVRSAHPPPPESSYPMVEGAIRAAGQLLVGSCPVGGVL